MAIATDHRAMLSSADLREMESPASFRASLVRPYIERTPKEKIMTSVKPFIRLIVLASGIQTTHVHRRAAGIYKQCSELQHTCRHCKTTWKESVEHHILQVVADGGARPLGRQYSA